MLRNVTSLTDSEELKIAVAVLRALAHPLRITLLNFVREHQPINVNEIFRRLEMDQAVVSQHLKILRDAKLVITTRRGKFIFYSVNIERLTRATQSADSLP